MPDHAIDPAAAFIEQIPGNALLGLAVTAMGDGTAAVRLPWRDEVTNHVGTMHAAALFGIADATSGAALLSGLGDLLAKVTPIARGGDITYRGPGRTAITGRSSVSADVLAAIRAELEADGVSRPDVVVHLEDEDGTEVATATFRWHLKVTG
jgi:acyl-coenzyme A thioesterase PaaI-like protein